MPQKFQGSINNNNCFIATSCFMTLFPYNIWYDCHDVEGNIKLVIISSHSLSSFKRQFVTKGPRLIFPCNIWYDCHDVDGNITP